MSTSNRGGLRGAKAGQRTAKRGGHSAQDLHTRLFGTGKKNNRAARGSRTGSQNASTRGAKGSGPPTAPRPPIIETKDYDARWSVLKERREKERATYDAERPRKLSEAVTPVGTCINMCPEFERVDRIRAKDVHRLERDDEGNPDESIMVKKFRKSAAGTDAQVQSDLRPPPILSHTLDYLFNDLLDDPESLRKSHGFLWDRTRGVRNDFSIQQVTSPEDVEIAVDCFERIARFHILSLHLSSGPDKPYADYSAQQDREQLDKALLSLMQYYEDNRTKAQFQNEPEFRAYCLILAIHNLKDNIEAQLYDWPDWVLKDARVRLAVRLHQAAWNASQDQGFGRSGSVTAQEDWSKFWKLLSSSQTSYLTACAAELSFPQVRQMALATILKAFKHKQSTDDLSLEDMTSVLGAWDTGEVENILKESNLDIGERKDGTRYFDFHTASGLPPVSPPQPPSLLVEHKRHRRTVPAVISGMSVGAASQQGLLDDAEMEEDDESMFVPESQPSEQPPLPTPSLFESPSSSAAASPVPNPTFASTANSGFGNSLFKKNQTSASANGNPSSGGFGQTPSAGDATGKKSVSWDPSVASEPLENKAATPSSFSFGSLNPTASAFSPSSTPLGRPQQEKDQKLEEARLKAAEVEREQAAEREQEARAKMEAQKRQEEETRLRNEQEKKRLEDETRQRALLEQAELQARRQAAEAQARREKEAEELKKKQESALNNVTEQLLLGEHGLLDMFVEHLGEGMFARAKEAYAFERANKEADEFRAYLLAIRYGRKWREVAYSRRLRREALERRRRAKRARSAAAATEARRKDVMTQLNEFKRSQQSQRDALASSLNSNGSSDTQPSNKENDPSRFSFARPSLVEQFKQNQQSQHRQHIADPHASHGQDDDLGASILTNNLKASSSKSIAVHEPGHFGRSASPPLSLQSSTSAARTSQLGLPYGEVYDTTVSPYFQMKAKLGRFVVESPQPSHERKGSNEQRKRPRSERYSEEHLDHLQKRFRTDHLQTQLGTTLGSNASRNDHAQDHRGASLLSTVVDGDKAGSDTEDDEVFASIRRANKIMSEGTLWLRDTMRSFQNTPEASPAPPAPPPALGRSIGSSSQSPSLGQSMRVSRFLGRPSKAERDLKKKQEAEREEEMIRETRQRAKQWQEEARQKVERANALAEAQELADKRKAEIAAADAVTKSTSAISKQQASTETAAASNGLYTANFAPNSQVGLASQPHSNGGQQSTATSAAGPLGSKEQPPRAINPFTKPDTGTGSPFGSMGIGQANTANPFVRPAEISTSPSSNQIASFTSINSRFGQPAKSFAQPVPSQQQQQQQAAASKTSQSTFGRLAPPKANVFAQPKRKVSGPSTNMFAALANQDEDDEDTQGSEQDDEEELYDDDDDDDDNNDDVQADEQDDEEELYDDEESEEDDEVPNPAQPAFAGGTNGFGSKAGTSAADAIDLDDD